MNAIHALSQLSYDPKFRPEGQILNLPKLPLCVKGCNSQWQVFSDK